MKQQLLFLCLLTTISYHAVAQVANTANDLVVCDDFVDDGLVSFDLTYNDHHILGSQDANDFTISYHLTLDGAEHNENAISNPVVYQNIINPQMVYARITALATGNFDTTSFQLLVVPLPVFTTPIDLELCDDTAPGSMIGVFDLSYNDQIIMNGQTDLGVSYFTALFDAQAGVHVISNPMDFTNTASPQTIFARVEDFVTGCFVITEFDLIVNPLASVNLEENYELCIGEALIIDTGLENTNYNFTWSLDSVVISSEIDATLDVTQAGTYQVTVTGVNGCSNSVVFIVTEVDCTDMDGDGVIDSDEDLNGNGNLDDDDTDGDTIPDYLDSDDDGDNVETIDEINIVMGRSANAMHPFVDTDGDLIENYLDDDDDGDGILTVDEDYNNNGDPTDDDTDMSGTPDYLEIDVALHAEEFGYNEFNMYPNPASKTVHLFLKNEIEGTIQIYDIQGKTIYTQSFSNKNELTLDVSVFESGLYFVKLNTGGQESIKKLIVN